MKHRFENFGGVISSQDPPFLAFVDREYMRELGLGESPLWDSEDQSIGVLSAPTEVHMAITNACSVGCRHCYMAAGEVEAGEMDTETFRRALRALAGMGVFHVALGGGDALQRRDLFEIAAYAREVGLVPNLTISGALMTPEIAARMPVFGQVNVSIDGVGKAHGALRGKEMFGVADQAVDMLVHAGCSTGVNCVLGRQNFEAIPELFEYARGKGLNELEFLRLKPSGRGGPLYAESRMTYQQNVRLAPMLAELAERFGVCAKIDCSFVPMYCYHRPDRELLEAMATYGCEAGNVLVGVRSNGLVSGCSFLRGTGISVFELGAAWRTDDGLERLRTFGRRAAEPCRSCSYLDICKGGCRAVAGFVTGDPDSPDPDCPTVVEHARERSRG